MNQYLKSAAVTVAWIACGMAFGYLVYLLSMPLWLCWGVGVIGGYLAAYVMAVMLTPEKS